MPRRSQGVHSLFRNDFIENPIEDRYLSDDFNEMPQKYRIPLVIHEEKLEDKEKEETKDPKDSTKKPEIKTKRSKHKVPLSDEEDERDNQSQYSHDSYDEERQFRTPDYHDEQSEEFSNYFDF